MKISNTLLKFLCIFSVVFLVISFKNQDPKKKTNPPKSDSITQKVDSVLALMHLNEKIGQLVQYAGKWDATGPTSTQNDQYKL